MGLYAGGFRARRKGMQVNMVVAVFASNDHEAEGLCLDETRNKLPKKDGWVGHQCITGIVQISPGSIIAAAKELGMQEAPNERQVS